MGRRPLVSRATRWGRQESIVESGRTNQAARTGPSGGLPRLAHDAPARPPHILPPFSCPLALIFSILPPCHLVRRRSVMTSIPQPVMAIAAVGILCRAARALSVAARCRCPRSAGRRRPGMAGRKAAATHRRASSLPFPEPHLCPLAVAPHRCPTEELPSRRRASSLPFRLLSPLAAAVPLCRSLRLHTTHRPGLRRRRHALGRVGRALRRGDATALTPAPHRHSAVPCTSALHAAAAVACSRPPRRVRPPVPFAGARGVRLGAHRLHGVCRRDGHVLRPHTTHVRAGSPGVSMRRGSRVTRCPRRRACPSEGVAPHTLLSLPWGPSTRLVVVAARVASASGGHCTHVSQRERLRRASRAARGRREIERPRLSLGGGSRGDRCAHAHARSV